MHRIDTSTAQKDKFGAGKNGFTGGNPQTGELPTALDQNFFDSVQEEICGVIEGGGIALNKADRGQMLKALKALFPVTALFANNTASPGYQKFPGGLVMQWGTAAVPVAGSVVATYPLTFTRGVFQLICPLDSSSTNNYRIAVATSTTGSITINSTNTQNVTGVMWMAVGVI
ncbi:hypothetical protein ACI2JB_01375 [Pantoea agglomerans]|uniref:gp53-like domain-containing protein n=1 Tax=Enterobacter agglomerans TaxID=549 RepID=UPI00384AD258